MNGQPENIRNSKILETVGRMNRGRPESDPAGGDQDGWVDLTGSRAADITENVEPGDTVQIESGAKTFTRTVTARHENNGVLEFADGTSYQPHVEQYDRVRAYVGEDDTEQVTMDEVARQSVRDAGREVIEEDDDGGDEGGDRLEESGGDRQTTESRDRRDGRKRQRTRRRNDGGGSDITSKIEDTLEEMDRAMGSGLSHTAITDTGPPHSFQSGTPDMDHAQDPNDYGTHTGPGQREKGTVPSDYESGGVGSGGYDAGLHRAGETSRGPQREMHHTRYDSEENFRGADVSDRKRPDRMNRKGDSKSVRHVGPHVETLSQAEMVARKLVTRIDDRKMSERLNRLADRCRNMAERARRGNADPSAVEETAEEAYREVSSALRQAGYDVEEAWGK